MIYFRRGSPNEPSSEARLLADALEASPPPGVVDFVPARASILVVFDPLQTTRHDVRDAVLKIAGVERAPQHRDAVEVPVLYGGEAGVDLAALAEGAGLSEREAAELHASVEYVVHFIGFMPGFPYMGATPQELRAPRLASPRTQVPAGSVAIADGWTGIYPVAGPGGWRLIGRSPYKLFDARQKPPSLLQPGGRVRFLPVTTAEFSRLHFQAASAGSLRARQGGSW